MPVPVGNGTAIITISQSSRASRPLLRASSTPAIGTQQLRATANWLVSANLDLRPFYALAISHPAMGPVVRSLHGLKPLRPATLFEMAVVAITEQQLSLAAAFHIRARLIRRFGRAIGNLWAFPTPQSFAASSLRDLGACGLSRRKAEYVRSLARRMGAGGLDFDALKMEPDERIREVLRSSRGLGEWSIEYILNRGFGRPDCLPSGDVGLRRVIGHYLGGGPRLTAAELQAALAPFAPFRGLAAYYVAVHWRLRHGARSGAKPPGGLLGATVRASNIDVAAAASAATSGLRRTTKHCRS